MPVLTAMFEKANNLLQTEGLVIQKPGATDGSYIVAGTANNLFTVNRGKGKASLKCEKTCIHSKTKICKHVLAVAEHTGMLDSFLKWFKSLKSSTSFSNLSSFF